MPREAIKMGAAEIVVALPDISRQLLAGRPKRAA
jgi:hypothetical protein